LPLSATRLAAAVDLGSVRRLAFAAYCAGVIGLVAYVATIEWSAAIGWVILRCAAVALLAAAPIFPWAGAAIYVFLAYGTPRYENDLEVLISSHVLDLVALLAVCAVLVRRRGPGDLLGGLRAPLSLLMLALAVWVLVTAVAALLSGLPWRPYPRHTPLLFAHGLAMFVVAQYALGTRTASWSFALATCLALVSRVLVQGADGLYLENDVAPLIVMVVPMAIMGFRLAPALPLKVLFAAGAIGLGTALLATQNRAAAVAAAAAVVVACWQWCRYRWLFGAGIAALAAAAIVLAPAGYKDRFRALWSGEAVHGTAALDRATAAERIELWRAGWAMADAQPWIGVGPGNYPHFVGLYAPGKQALPAHSNYIHMLAETGFPGLFLYLALFAAALLVLGRVRQFSADGDQRFAAAMLQLSLVAYLVAGVFLSRHDLVLAYLLTGWAATLSARPWAGSQSGPAHPFSAGPRAVQR
jgi:O-antigen ligase